MENIKFNIVKTYITDSKDILEYFYVFLKRVNRLLKYMKLLNKTDNEDILYGFKIFMYVKNLKF
jgi:hypothetical protein